MNRATKYILACLLLVWTSGLCIADEIPSAFEKMLQSQEKLKNYVLQYRAKEMDRAMTSGEDGEIALLDSFEEREYSSNMAYDRGKRMHVADIPRVMDGKVVSGQIDHVQYVYDGSKQISRRKNGAVYVISTAQKSLSRMMSPFTLFEDSIDYLPKSFEDIRQGKTKVKEVDSSEFHVVELSHDNGFKTVWTFDKKKDYAIQMIQLYYPSGSICHERKILEWKEFAPDVWLPMKAIYTGYRENGDLNRKHEFEVVEATVNAPQVDPSLFTLEIPAGATIYHADLNLRQTMSGESSDLSSLEEQLFTNMEKKLATEQSGEARVEGQATSATTLSAEQHDEAGLKITDQPSSSNKRLWALGGTAALIVIIVVMTIRRKRTNL